MESEEAVALEIRRDIYEKHASLFGEKTVNGKKVNVEELITKLTRENSGDFRSLLGDQWLIKVKCRCA